MMLVVVPTAVEFPRSAWLFLVTVRCGPLLHAVSWCRGLSRLPRRLRRRRPGGRPWPSKAGRELDGPFRVCAAVPPSTPGPGYTPGVRRRCPASTTAASISRGCLVRPYPRTLFVDVHHGSRGLSKPLMRCRGPMIYRSRARHTGRVISPLSQQVSTSSWTLSTTILLPSSPLLSLRRAWSRADVPGPTRSAVDNVSGLGWIWARLVPWTILTSRPTGCSGRAWIRTARAPRFRGHSPTPLRTLAR